MVADSSFTVTEALPGPFSVMVSRATIPILSVRSCCIHCFHSNSGTPGKLMSEGFSRW